MDYELAMEGIIGSLLAILVLLYRLRRKTNQKICVMNSSKYETIKISSVAAPDIIIVGAGVVGSSFAYALGKDGRQVQVIERDLNEPDRIVGELLQPGGYIKLIELGLKDCVEEIDAQRIFRYAMFKDGKSTKLSYPLESYQSNGSRRSFHNGRFIQRMREKVASLFPSTYLCSG
ncbi:squalene epoxidase 3 [Euphorbia peplus]|nr:squalene epoxidase 3 [Euphorbia peplus]